MAKELDTSIQYLSGVGPKRAELLRRTEEDAPFTGSFTITIK